MPFSRALRFFVAAAILGWGSKSLADTGYEALADWNSLANSKLGITAGLFSSYDRNEDTLGLDGLPDTNNDYNNFMGTTPDGWQIIGSLSGPGELTRLWMPTLTATPGNPAIRLIADGTLNGNGSVTGGTIVLNTDGSHLFSGSGGAASTTDPNTYPSLFQSPLVTTRLGGQVSYEPIQFQHSLVVEMQPATSTATFYQANYHLFPTGTAIPTYNGQLSAAQQSQRQQAAAMIAIDTPSANGTMPSGAGSNPAGVDPAALTQSVSAALGAGQTLSLANLNSGGTIRALQLNLSSALSSLSSSQQTALLQGLRLRIRYDSSPGNAVDVPVSQFFGVGEGRHDYQSLPLGVNPNDHSYYSYWPMPYRQNAVVELYNGSGISVSGVSGSVEYNPTAPNPNAEYFHAVSNSAVTTSGQTLYNLIHVTGSGHYVGNVLTMIGPDRSLMEGDDAVTVDGNQRLWGTGFEDGYNSGYYFNHLNENTINGDQPDPTFQNEPYYGLLQYSDPGGGPFRVDAYRWLIGDFVPFNSSLDVSQENFGQLAGVQFESTAFYYSTSVPEPSLGMLCVVGPFLLARRRKQEF